MYTIKIITCIKKSTFLFSEHWHVHVYLVFFSLFDQILLNKSNIVESQHMLWMKEFSHKETLSNTLYVLARGQRSTLILHMTYITMYNTL